MASNLKKLRQSLPNLSIPIKSQQYVQLPDSETSQPQRKTRNTFSSYSSILAVLACFVIIIGAGSWFYRQVTQPPPYTSSPSSNSTLPSNTTESSSHLANATIPVAINSTESTKQVSEGQKETAGLPDAQLVSLIEDTHPRPGNGEQHLVIASMTNQDLSWMDRVVGNWSVKRYIMDDLNPPPSLGLKVPRLYGREVMAYLTYIIDHYDDLPSYVAFIHGHHRAWHQIEPIAMKVNALNLTAVANEHYVSFRCGDAQGCESNPFIDTENLQWDGLNNIRKFYDYLMPGEELPRYITTKCCAQFAVTAEAIRMRPKSEWIRIREPLFMEEADMRANMTWGQNPDADEWHLGLLYEKYWHLFFFQGPTYCPSPHYCHQVHFSNAIVCDGDVDVAPWDNTWFGTVCKSAFDDLRPGESVNWTDWELHVPRLKENMSKEKMVRLGQR